MLTDVEVQEVELFLQLLFSWEGDDAQLYKSVSWTFPKEDGSGLGLANYATQSLADLIKLIATRYERGNANTYVCMGMQRVASTEKFATDGFPKAIRQHKNIVCHKSIWLDIDVKPSAYATTDDAFAALDDFCRVTGMPVPTMEVYSGSGGLHVYWCLDKPITQANWLPIAKGLQAAALNYGLKFDPAPTVNPAGILRVPNTWNHKSSPPTRTFLYHKEDGSFPYYDYQQIVGILGVHAQEKVPPAGSKANAKRSSNFSAGIDTAAPIVPIDDVA